MRVLRRYRTAIPGLLQTADYGRAMRAQLEQLIELSRLPHVTIRVIPYAAGAYQVMDSTFRILAGPTRASESFRAGLPPWRAV